MSIRPVTMVAVAAALAMKARRPLLCRPSLPCLYVGQLAL